MSDARHVRVRSPVLRLAGRRLYTLALWLLPRSLRRRAGSSMLAVFEERQCDAVRAGTRSSLLRVWLHEVGGLIVVAWQSRRGDAWFERFDRVMERDLGDMTAHGGRAASGSGAGRGRADRLARPGPTVPVRNHLREGIAQDVRFAIRAAARRPAPYALALVACGLGIGASTAMFSVVDSVLWRPLPYPEPDRIVMVYPTIPEWLRIPMFADRWQRGSWSYPEYVDWARMQTAFSEHALIGRSMMTITGPGEPQRIRVGDASPSLFPMLGVVPVAGRTFIDGEGFDTPGCPVLLSYGFWQSRFGGSRDVVGTSLRTDGGECTIVGVLPESFAVSGLQSDVWYPLGGPADERTRDDHNGSVIARLGSGVTIDAATDETARLLGAMSDDHYTKHGAFLVPRREDETRQVRTPLSILLAASLLLLAVACVNVAALVLGLGIDREHELVVRGAIGAGRRRLIRQLVTESLVLALLGGIAGVVLAFGLTRVLVALAPAGIPRIEYADVSARAVVFATLVTAVVGIAFGLVPAMSLTGEDLTARMRGGRATGGRGRLHASLVVAQLALACVLLIGAGLLTHTLIRLDRVDPGFDADGVMGIRIAPSFRQFVDNGTFVGSRLDRYYSDMQSAIAAVPGVIDVAMTSAMPYSGDSGNNYVTPGGGGIERTDSTAAARYYVSANYMSLVRMRIIDGRGFDRADDRADASPVTIVSETAARHLWPGERALGKTLRFYAGTFTVVGVVADIRDRSLEQANDLRFFVPSGQRAGQSGSFVIRAAAGIDTGALSTAIRDRIRDVDAGVPVTWIGTIRERIVDSLAEHRFRSRLIAAFAIFAALFALLGIYGVTSRSVASRTREIGIRMALGQQRTGVIRLVLGQGIRLTAIGATLGLLGGIAASRVLAAWLYETSASDPLTLTIVVIAVGCLALAASLPPSLRAARVDPAITLRGH